MIGLALSKTELAQFNASGAGNSTVAPLLVAGGGGGATSLHGGSGPPLRGLNGAGGDAPGPMKGCGGWGGQEGRGGEGQFGSGGAGFHTDGEAGLHNQPGGARLVTAGAALDAQRAFLLQEGEHLGGAFGGGGASLQRRARRARAEAEVR